ncbi:MAG: glycogen synthase [Candidatus Omnitrophica bacterium]|nr:glycogen synthase [Candidatus Omnitrophota bacterium]
MKILFLSSEMAPFAKTGGLGDVVGSLAGAVRALGHDVSVFLPRYRSIDIQQWELETAIDYFELIVGNQLEATRIFSKKLENGIKVYFVEHPDYFMREELYGTLVGDYQDNDRRFTYFQRAALKAAEKLKLAPDIVHCHDWQTGLVPVYLKTAEAGSAALQKARSVFTIHNLAYQGNFPPDSFPATGLGWEFYKSDLLEFYGKFSFLKGGLVFADAVTTVSERYSCEIQTKEFGCGMEGVLAARKDSVTGIINGIDPKDWDPATDPDIDAKYDLKDLSGKKLNKAALQKENGFKVDPNIPLLGFVARLVDQKGLDILVPVLERLSELLIPSYYEPCGLGQIIGLRFGTVPIVRATGGLADTIQNFEPASQKGNGFIFEEYTSDALHAVLLRAVKTFKQEKLWKSLVKNAMESDFSWNASAKKYEKLYESVKRRPFKIEKS